MTTPTGKIRLTEQEYELLESITQRTSGQARMVLETELARVEVVPEADQTLENVIPIRSPLAQHESAVTERQASDPVEEASMESFPASDAPGWRL